MQGSKKEPDIRTAKSTSDYGYSCHSWWSPVESHQQATLSKNSSLKMGVPSQGYHSLKLLNFSFQDQDSCSTQSTGQSYSGAASTEENDLNPQGVVFTQSGYNMANGKREDGETKVNTSTGTQNYLFPHLQADQNQSYPQLAIPFPEQFFNDVHSLYGPQALVMGVIPARVPLPLELSTSEPIYVNPKQYHGILRRRQHRAKLEAQNKLAKNRKPYLHESRHQHALKRARGSGGRFLNMKKLQELASASTADGRNHSVPVPHPLGGNWFPTEVHQQENYKEGTSTTSCSDVTSTSTGDDIYHPLEFSFSSYSGHVRGVMHGGGGNYV